MYKITDYSYKQADILNVKIKPSKKKNKKIDVVKNGDVVASIGDKRYLHYPNYIKSDGLAFAEQRRKLYRIRHKKDLKKMNTPGYFATKILW